MYKQIAQYVKQHAKRLGPPARPAAAWHFVCHMLSICVVEDLYMCWYILGIALYDIQSFFSN